MNCTGWPPNTPYDSAEARRTQVADATFRDFKKSLKCSFHTFRCPQSGCSVSSPVEPLAVLHCVAAKPCCQKAWQIVKGGPEVPSEWQCECKERCQHGECELSLDLHCQSKLVS